MAIVVEEVLTTTETSNTKSIDVDINFATLNSGDRIIIIFAKDGSGNNATSSNFTRIDSLSTDHRVFERIADGMEGTTETISWTVNNEQSAAIAIRLSGAHATTASEVADTAIVATTSVDPPNLTPSWGSAENAWIAGGMTNVGASITSWATNYSANQTTINTGAGGSSCSAFCATRILDATSENPGAFTSDTNWFDDAITIAVRPAAAGGTTKRYSLTLSGVG